MGSREQATRDRIRRFEAEVLVHLDDLYRAARRLTRNAAEAQDLTQDTCCGPSSARTSFAALPPRASGCSQS
jgi:RNA polymerase sigma-70 factor (ECF subfamily)